MPAFKTSTGLELRFFMPVLNVPFRLIFAMNPQRDGVLLLTLLLGHPGRNLAALRAWTDARSSLKLLKTVKTESKNTSVS